MSISLAIYKAFSWAILAYFGVLIARVVYRVEARKHSADVNFITALFAFAFYTVALIGVAL